MSKKIFITFLFTIFLAIAALFAGTQVLAQEPRIAQRVISDVVLTFSSPDGNKYEARIKRDVLDLRKGWKVRLFDLDKRKDITELIVPKELEKFTICEQLEKGNVTIDDRNYFCHRLKEVSDGALIIGNNTCLFTIAPGIVIDLCPHPHPHQN